MSYLGLDGVQWPVSGLRQPLDSDAALPLFQGVPVPRYRFRRRADEFLKYVLLNPHVGEILRRLHMVAAGQVWLTSGCLVQTIWNLREGRPPASDIDDYDLIYFDADTSWEAEDAVIRRCATIFADLPITVQIRNQARVPLWYRDKFSISYPPVRDARHALLRFPARTTAIGVTCLDGGVVAYYAPFGFSDALEMTIRPNRRLALDQVYAQKAERWRAKWPALRFVGWTDSQFSKERLRSNAAFRGPEHVPAQLV